MPAGQKRRPPPYVIDALDRLAEVTQRSLPLPQFELMLGEAWPRHMIMRAVSALRRRGWVELSGTTLHITDDGLAATRGEGVVPPKRPLQAALRANRRTRMPKGLF